MQKYQPEKEIPHNLQAEMYLLGTLLQSHGMALINDKIKAEDFYVERHQQIFKAMTALDRACEAIDFITVEDQLKQQEVTIEGELGGGNYLFKLMNVTLENFLLPIKHLEEHAIIIADKSLARRGLQACQQTAEWFYFENARAAQAKAEALFANLATEYAQQSDFIPLAESVTESVLRISNLHDIGGGIVGIPTGFHDLDHLLSGLQNDKLILVAGRPGSGKTSFALTLAHQAAKGGCKIGILSMEMSRGELTDRLISIEAGIDSRRVSTGYLDDDEWETFEAAARVLSALPISIDDAFGATLNDLRSRAKRMQATRGLDLLIVDYLQLMDADGKETDNEVRQLSVISRGLKMLARELHIPVIALAQLNRALESRASKIPQLSDLRGSGTLEQDADIVGFVYREEEYNQETDRKGQADIIIAKHRGGPKGTVVLGFDATQTRFYNWISDEEAAQYR